MMRARYFIVCLLLLTASLQAQTIVFYHLGDSTTRSIQAGQKVKIYTLDRHIYAGKLLHATNDSLYFKRRHSYITLPVSQVDKIRFRSVTKEESTRFLLTAGWVLFGGGILLASFLFVPAMASEAAYNALSFVPKIIVPGAGLLIIGMIVGGTSKQWIKHPAKEWRIEVIQTKPVDIP